MTVNDEIRANLEAVNSSIAAAIDDYDRPEGAVQLIAVSKVQPIERVRAAVIAGHRLFGENRVQEALARWQPIRQEFDDIAVHLIGPLQTNKARDAVGFFDAIHTLDRPRLAAALAREMDRQDRRPDCYIEVNTGAEPQKAGVRASEADDFIRQCRVDYALPIVGLMCIPPAYEAPALHFALLREIARRNGLTNLSMGMSGDYQTAIAFDATLVRVGTAVFGAREIP
jgi:pyridoxal phosphate enzyme (YggS family)